MTRDMTDIFVQKYSTIDTIFSIHYSQIENTLESEKMLKLDFSLLFPIVTYTCLLS